MDLLKELQQDKPEVVDACLGQLVTLVEVVLEVRAIARHYEVTVHLVLAFVLDVAVSHSLGRVSVEALWVLGLDFLHGTDGLELASEHLVCRADLGR